MTGVLLAGLLAPLAVCRTTETVEPVVLPPADPRKGRVLARVDGFPIHEADVGVKDGIPNVPPDFGPGRGNEDQWRREAIDHLLQLGIERVVLVREARRKGCDRGLGHLRKAMARDLDLLRKVRERVAGRMQQREREDLAKWVSSSITGEAVEAYYRKWKDFPPYSGMDEAFAKHDIRNMLVYEGTSSLYERWLRDRLAVADIRVNGLAVPREALFTALLAYMPTQVTTGRPAGATVYAILLETLETDSRGGVVTGSPARLFGNAVVQVNEGSISLGDPVFQALLAGGGPAGPGPGGPDRHGLSFRFFKELEKELLVQEAMRAHVTLAPDEAEALVAERGEAEATELIATLLEAEGIFREAVRIPERRRAFVRDLKARSDIRIFPP